MSLELGTGFGEEGVPLDAATFEEDDEDGVTRMNLVTWDPSSVVVRFIPVLLVAAWENPEPLCSGTATLFFTNEA